MKRTFCWLALSLCLGIMAAQAARFQFTGFFITAALCAIFSVLFIRHAKKSGFFILLAVFFLGGALMRQSQSALASQMYFAENPNADRLVELVLLVASEPLPETSGISFVGSVEKIKIGTRYQPAAGTIIVNSHKTDIVYGNRIRVRGILNRPPSLQFSKKFNYRDFLDHKAIHFFLTVRKGGIIEIISSRSGNLFRRFAFAIKRRVQEKVSEYMPVSQAAIINTIILGIRGSLPVSIKEMFIRTGTVHVLAISGLHVGIIGFIAMIVLRSAGAPRKLSFVIIVPLLLFYCLLAGLRISVIRATLMAIIVCIGYVFDREADIYNSLSLAAFIILLRNPQELFSAGFQLSFASVISIVWLSPKIVSFLSGFSHGDRILRAPVLLVSVSSAAWLGVFPLVAYYFEIVTPVAILANLVIVPYIGLVIASCLTFILSTFLVPSASVLFAAASQLAIDGLLLLVSFFSRIPGGYFYIANVSILHTFMYYIVIYFVFNFSTIHNSLNLNKLQKIFNI